MKTIKNIVFILIAVVAVSCENAPEISVRTRECAEMPSPRASASVCTLGDKAYIFGGRAQNGRYYNDLWSYDPSSDSWSQITGFPGRERVSAAITAYDGVLYLGLGYGTGGIYEESCYLHDWWRWDPKSNTWDSLAPYPQETTVDATLFVAGARIYVMYGTSTHFTREVNYYDTKTNSWHSIPDNYHRALSAFGSVGAYCEGTYFYGLGNNTSNLKQWYQVDIESDKWTQRSSAPGKGRTFSACAASEHHIYVFGGRYFGGELTGGEIFKEILRYTPASDQWSHAGDMPCGRAENQIAFSIDNKVYFGLGEDENKTLIKKLYCIEE